MSALVSVDLPAPGAPVRPTVYALAAERIARAAPTSRAGAPPCSTSESRRASAPRSPARAAVEQLGRVTLAHGAGTLDESGAATRRRRPR